jgi:hypothetical protein
MAALLPLFGEVVLNGAEAAGAGSIVSGIYNEFKPVAKKLITDEAGKIVGDYARNNPDGYVDNIVQKASVYRKRKNSRRVG